MLVISIIFIEEGVEIVFFKFVLGGKFNVIELYRLFVEELVKFFGCSGCRNYCDVESDIKVVS